MDGHYHVEFWSGWAINDTLEKCAQTIAKNNLKIRRVGFVCTYGCGVTHDLTPEDRKALGLNPDLTRRSDVDALLEQCDKASQLVDDVSELGGISPRAVQEAIEEIKKGIRKLHAKKPVKPKTRKRG